LSGLLSRMDAKVGEIAAASGAVAAVISDAKFQIEANLPEADISKVKINDFARLTLDAYGSDVRFEARVAALDPAETIVEGVVTYKATFEFLAEDSRIRPGMTANLDILTARRENVLTLPSRAVRTKDSVKFVLRQRTDGSLEEVEVKLGLLGSDGRMEIVSGLEAGDKVALGRVAD
ncbi:MAG: HlyD family efflux transporter periplasmic adaptor subunit, partial [Patescibacteria group bacterium]